MAMCCLNESVVLEVLDEEGKIAIDRGIPVPLKVCEIPRLQGLANDLSYPCGAVVSLLCTFGWYILARGVRAVHNLSVPPFYSGISFGPGRLVARSLLPCWRDTSSLL